MSVKPYYILSIQYNFSFQTRIEEILPSVNVPLVLHTSSNKKRKAKRANGYNGNDFFTFFIVMKDGRTRKIVVGTSRA
jgi:hypothetical protein